MQSKEDHEYEHAKDIGYIQRQEALRSARKAKHAENTGARMLATIYQIAENYIGILDHGYFPPPSTPELERLRDLADGVRDLLLPLAPSGIDTPEYMIACMVQAACEHVAHTPD